MPPKGHYTPLGDGDGDEPGHSQIEMTAANGDKMVSYGAEGSTSSYVEAGSSGTSQPVGGASGSIPDGVSPLPAAPGKARHGDGSDDDDSGSDSDIDVFPPRLPPGTHLATLAQKKALWWRNVLITGMFILTWYAFATLLSMYNKWMFSEEYYGFSYPLFVTACHMVVQFLCAAVIRVTLAARFRPVERPTRRDYVTRILPTAWATGGDIGLSNLSLKTITLTLYTMCKSSALIFVLMFAFLFRLEKFSVRLISVIGLITLGVFMMVFNTTEASIPGIIMVLSASAIGGLRWALTELIMHKKAMGLSNPFATIFWLAPPMGIILLVVSALIEDWRAMFMSEYFANPLIALRSIGVIVLPGVLAFAMVASEFFVIQRAGVVPLSVAGIAKEVSTISFAGWVFGDKLTMLNMIGVVVTISGIALYSFHKYRKSMRREVRLDAAENPIEADENDERAPLRRHHRTRSALSTASNRSTRSARSTHSAHSSRAVVPLQDLDGEHHAVSTPAHGAGVDANESHADRVARLRDEFEGWDDVGVDSDAESEANDDEVARARADKVGGLRHRWESWWDRPV